MEKMNICRFIPTSPSADESIALNFVHERTWTKDSATVYACNKMCLVTAGSAVLKADGKQTVLEKGDLFFILLAKEFTLCADEGFEFMYISFIGSRVRTILDRLDIEHGIVFKGFSFIQDFWEKSISRISPANGDFICESVMAYTFSYLAVNKSDHETSAGYKNAALIAKKFVDSNFTDSTVSLESVAKRFGYNKNYLSSKFLITVGTRFSEYITALRMEYADRLIQQGVCVVSELSFMCGYEDPLYFSKVFKKAFGSSPKQKMIIRNK